MLLLFTNYPNYTREIPVPPIPLDDFVALEASIKSREIDQGKTAVAVVMDKNGREIARHEAPASIDL